MGAVNRYRFGDLGADISSVFAFARRVVAEHATPPIQRSAELMTGRAALLDALRHRLPRRVFVEGRIPNASALETERRLWTAASLGLRQVALEGEFRLTFDAPRDNAARVRSVVPGSATDESTSGHCQLSIRFPGERLEEDVVREMVGGRIAACQAAGLISDEHDAPALLESLLRTARQGSREGSSGGGGGSPSPPAVRFDNITVELGGAASPASPARPSRIRIDTREADVSRVATVPGLWLPDRVLDFWGEVDAGLLVQLASCYELEVDVRVPCDSDDAMARVMGLAGDDAILLLWEPATWEGVAAHGHNRLALYGNCATEDPQRARGHELWMSINADTSLAGGGDADDLAQRVADALGADLEFRDTE